MSTTMDQIHHIRELFYQQDKNISQIVYIPLRVVLPQLSVLYNFHISQFCFK